MTLLEGIARVAVAAALSGAVGFEREAAQKAAGLRTHMLVGLGSALFAILSLEGFPGTDPQASTDPSRIASNVVTGIGFLGAGAIFREGRLVRGLTTAAGLWTVAAVGLAAGAGLFALAAAVTAVALLVLWGARGAEHVLRARAQRVAVDFEVKLSDLAELGQVLEAAYRIVGRPIRPVEYQSGENGGGSVRFEVPPGQAGPLSAVLTTMEGVETAEQVH
ncbi:MAG: MgtC/SapB family protein [Actinomycetota bacterium]|nr:MgtC/SapB family protein [Actinomycetota bacterium]